jgi:hypothetical protein
MVSARVPKMAIHNVRITAPSGIATTLHTKNTCEEDHSYLANLAHHRRQLA